MDEGERSLLSLLMGILAIPVFEESQINPSEKLAIVFSYGLTIVLWHLSQVTQSNIQVISLYL